MRKILYHLKNEKKTIWLWTLEKNIPAIKLYSHILELKTNTMLKNKYEKKLRNIHKWIKDTDNIVFFEFHNLFF